VVQADGQLKTGRDVVIAALLGAEEFGSPPRRWSSRLHHDAGLPPGHVSGGVATQNPGPCARSSAARPSSWSTSSSSSPRRSASTWPHWASAASPSGRAYGDAGHQHAIQHWKARAGPSPILHLPPELDPEPPAPHQGAGPRAGQGAGQTPLIQLAEGALDGGEPVGWTCRCAREPTVGTCSATS